MKSVLLITAASFAFFAASVVPAFAADHTYWKGKEINHEGIVWRVTHMDGNDWKVNVSDQGDFEYEGVTSTDDYTELQMKGAGSKRIRLYKDRLSMNDADDQNALGEHGLRRLGEVDAPSINSGGHSATK